jgi:hypothetical protein
MYPRTEEEQQRGYMPAFVSFVSRDAAERCKAHLDSTPFLGRYVLRVGWGKSVARNTIAKSTLAAAAAGKQNEPGSNLVPFSTHGFSDGSQSSSSSVNRIRVKFPIITDTDDDDFLDHRLRMIIDSTARIVADEGHVFEQILMQRWTTASSSIFLNFFFFNREQLNPTWLEYDDEEEKGRAIDKAVAGNSTMTMTSDDVVSSAIETIKPVTADISQQKINHHHHYCRRRKAFDFLFEPGSRDNNYYRWRVFSYSMGDGTGGDSSSSASSSSISWRTDPFKICLGGNLWFPPPSSSSMSMVADFDDDTEFSVGHAAVAISKTSSSSAGETVVEGPRERERRLREAENKSSSGGQILDDESREDLNALLKHVTISRKSILCAMVFSVNRWWWWFWWWFLFLFFS